MRVLEERLDVSCSRRGPRGVKLTVAGERLHREVAPHFEAIQLALRRPAKSNESALRITRCRGSPRVGSYRGCRNSWLRRTRHRLSLSASWDSGGFRARRHDAALRFGVAGWPQVHADLLFDEWVLPVATPSLLARHRRRGFADLGRWPLLGDSVGRWGLWFARNRRIAAQAIRCPLRFLRHAGPRRH